MIWTKQKLERALSTELHYEGPFLALKFNSLDVKPGDIFIALIAKRDGHEYAREAIDKGASIAIVSREIEGINPDKLIIVEDTYKALWDLAEYKRRTVNAKFIAVTGSVGKTTTKELIRIMLSAYGKTFASHGSFNNDLGVPVTLASIEDDVEYVIVEMGMNAAGELRFLSNLVTPDIALLTSVSEAHIEFFNSLEEIADAKCEIFEGIDINEGIAIINCDMEMYERCIKNIDGNHIQNLQTFGKSIDCGTRFISSRAIGNEKLKLKYVIDGLELEAITGPMPPHFTENIAAALAVVKALNLDYLPAIEALSSFEPGFGRGKLVYTTVRDKNFGIICDYYNANQQSMIAAFNYLAQTHSRPKVAIIGDMGELGADSIRLHKGLVEHINNIGLKQLFLVGPRMDKLRDDIEKGAEIYSFETADKLALKIYDLIEDKAMILIKGSRSMKLEVIAEKLGVRNAL